MNGQQKVRIETEESKFKSVKSGVPQDSILGPLLFILFINDLHLVLESTCSHLYADDTTLHNSVPSIITLNGIKYR